MQKHLRAAMREPMLYFVVAGAVMFFGLQHFAAGRSHVDENSREPIALRSRHARS